MSLTRRIFMDIYIAKWRICIRNSTVGNFYVFIFCGISIPHPRWYNVHATYVHNRHCEKKNLTLYILSMFAIFEFRANENIFRFKFFIFPFLGHICDMHIFNLWHISYTRQFIKNSDTPRCLQESRG